MAKETLSLEVNGAADQDRALSQLQGAEAGRQADPDHQHRRRAAAGGDLGCGAPVTPEPAASNGFKIERNYFTLDGKPADRRKAKQNDRFAVVLKITEAKPEYGHIMVADYLPAGFEIDNPHLVSSGDTGTLDWIEDGEEPVNTEFRDDRFTRGHRSRKR